MCLANLRTFLIDQNTFNAQLSFCRRRGGWFLVRSRSCEFSRLVQFRLKCEPGRLLNACLSLEPVRLEVPCGFISQDVSIKWFLWSLFTHKPVDLITIPCYQIYLTGLRVNLLERNHLINRSVRSGFGDACCDHSFLLLLTPERDW